MGVLPPNTIELKTMKAILKDPQSPSNSLLFPNLLSLTWIKGEAITSSFLWFLGPKLSNLRFRFNPPSLVPRGRNQQSLMDRFIETSLPNLNKLQLEGPITLALATRMEAKLKKINHLNISLAGDLYTAPMDSQSLVSLFALNALESLKDIEIQADIPPDRLCKILQTIGSRIKRLTRLKIAVFRDTTASWDLGDSSEESLIHLVDALGTCQELRSLTLIPHCHLPLATRAVGKIAANLEMLEHLALLTPYRGPDDQQDLSVLELLAKLLPSLRRLELQLAIPRLQCLRAAGSCPPAFTFHRPVDLYATFALPYPYNHTIYGLQETLELEREGWKDLEEGVWDYIKAVLPRGSAISRLDEGFFETWDDAEWGDDLGRRLAAHDGVGRDRPA
ncbi:hypothetical protein FRB90_010571 [Tulasnella sp. 427]|nr:hypothetical protein FRB90_010571 [Tulasnella sp. 427]